MHSKAVRILTFGRILYGSRDKEGKKNTQIMPQIVTQKVTQTVTQIVTKIVTRINYRVCTDRFFDETAIEVMSPSIKWSSMQRHSTKWPFRLTGHHCNDTHRWNGIDEKSIDEMAIENKTLPRHVLDRCGCITKGHVMKYYWLKETCAQPDI